MRIRLSNPMWQRRLLAFLAFDPTVIVALVDETEIEVSFLGSLNAWAQRRELELRLRAWLSAHPEAVAVLLD